MLETLINSHFHEICSLKRLSHPPSWIETSGLGKVAKSKGRVRAPGPGWGMSRGGGPRGRGDRGRGSLGRGWCPELRTAVVGWKNPSGACCCCRPRCLLPVLYASPSVFPQRVHLPVGLSEVTRRSPDRHLSISNHPPPSSLQVSPMDLQARPPPPHPPNVWWWESQRQRHTEGQALLLFPSLTHPPHPPFQNLNEHFWKSPEGPGEVPRGASMLWSDSVCVSLSCLLGWCCELPHGAVSATEACLLWVGVVGPSTSGLPRRHGQTLKARDFCYSKPEGNVENNTFSLSLKKKKKEEKRKKCSACELSAAVRATYDFLLFSEHSCLIL